MNACIGLTMNAVVTSAQILWTLSTIFPKSVAPWASYIHDLLFRITTSSPDHHQFADRSGQGDDNHSQNNNKDNQSSSIHALRLLLEARQSQGFRFGNYDPSLLTKLSNGRLKGSAQVWANQMIVHALSSALVPLLPHQPSLHSLLLIQIQKQLFSGSSRAQQSGLFGCMFFGTFAYLI